MTDPADITQTPRPTSSEAPREPGIRSEHGLLVAEYHYDGIHDATQRAAVWGYIYQEWRVAARLTRIEDVRAALPAAAVTALRAYAATKMGDADADEVAALAAAVKAKS